MDKYETSIIAFLKKNNVNPGKALDICSGHVFRHAKIFAGYFKQCTAIDSMLRKESLKCIKKYRNIIPIKDNYESYLFKDKFDLIAYCWPEINFSSDFVEIFSLTKHLAKNGSILLIFNKYGSCSDDNGKIMYLYNQLRTSSESIENHSNKIFKKMGLTVIDEKTNFCNTEFPEKFIRMYTKNIPEKGNAEQKKMYGELISLLERGDPRQTGDCNMVLCRKMKTL